MFEDEAQEMYEEPDYNVWETNRVYEDMALERADAEADAEVESNTEALTRIVAAAVDHRTYDDFVPSWDSVVEDIVLALVAAGVEVPEA